MCCGDTTQTEIAARGSLLARVVLALISIYRRVVSPLLPPACRFYPTCSEYATAAVRHHGVARGLWLALRRLLRCHPFNAGGFDPVPGIHPAKLD